MIDTSTVETVPDHELLRCIGSGSYGRVWLARTLTGSYRAVKIVNRRSFAEARPFEREFNGIRKYEPISRSHPGLVQILHVGQNVAAGYFYYVMELADDLKGAAELDPLNYTPHTLQNDMSQRGRLPLKDCLRAGVMLATALDHLHAHGLVHRDVKPGNVVFLHGMPKLVDIGLVADIGEAVTFVGTEGYVPPEGPGTPLADVFALGKLLYEMGTGHPAAKFPALPAGYENEPEGATWKQFYDVVFKACALNARRRLQTGREFGALLQALQGADAQTLPAGAGAVGGGAGGAVRAAPVAPRSVGILSGLRSKAHEGLVEALQAGLAGSGVRTFTDQVKMEDVDAAREMERSIVTADAVVALLSRDSIGSEFLAYQLELAAEAANRPQGRMRVFGLRVSFDEPLSGDLSNVLGNATMLAWKGAADTDAVCRQIREALEPATSVAARASAPVKLEALGGAVPLDSKFYVVREADDIFRQAVAAGESTVLVKGGRQMGKTSLLARGLQEARKNGVKVILTDLQKLNANCFASVDKFYQALGQSVTEQLDLDVFPEDVWDARRSPNTNFERFLRREVLDKVGTKMIWGLDEVDRLFGTGYSDEIFGLFRSWHNTRALDPDCPWRNLTLAIAYATEVHLFIKDMNQSPFNVGTRLVLEDFDRRQVAELNERYGSPLTGEADLGSLYALLGGHPFLIRLALHELKTGGRKLSDLESDREMDEGVFADHLRRILISLAKDAQLTEAIKAVLAGAKAIDAEAFYRLRSSGLILGSSANELRLRCLLYERFFRRHLK